MSACVVNGPEWAEMCRKAQHLAPGLCEHKCPFVSEGAVLASDAFFPFSDVVDLAAQKGIAAIIQPGGSIKDQDSIEACDENNMAMILTGIRHFRH